jgi:hypothetical protein
VGDTVEDIKQINGSGIDTQQERNEINYRPNLEYTKPVINSTPYTAASNISLDNLEASVRPLVVPNTANTWTGSVAILDSLNDIKAEFEDLLKNVSATIPVKHIDLVTEAAQTLGGDVSNGTISFDLYKKALLSEDSHEKIILTDIYESYQADVNGSLVGELYPDVVEMTQDWESILEFIKKGLFLQFVDSSELPAGNTIDDAVLATITSAEQAMIDKFLALRASNQASASEMRLAKINARETDEYYNARADFYSTYTPLRDIKRRLYSKNEISSLVQSKVDNVEPLVNSIVAYSDYSPYQGTVYNTLYSLIQQYSSGQQAQNGLRKVQALLKLSIDGKIEATDSAKENLRGLASNQVKTNVNKSLVKGVHLRNEVFGDIYDAINVLDAPTEDATFNEVAEHIVGSLTQADSLYTEQSSDFYKIHSLDTDLRSEKLNMLVDKDSARQFYNIIDRLISYTGTASWPPKANLAEWLQEFIKQEGLSE